MEPLQTRGVDARIEVLFEVGEPVVPVTHPDGEWSHPARAAKAAAVDRQLLEAVARAARSIADGD